MDKLIKTLHEGHHALVVGNGGIHTFDGRGVSDLYRLLSSHPTILQGAMIADKVVGKGAAALMVLAKVKQVYADVVSQKAIDLLQQHHIPTTYTTRVPYIMNQAGTAMCPLEMRCLPCATAEECREQIEQFMHKRP